MSLRPESGARNTCLARPTRCHLPASAQEHSEKWFFLLCQLPWSVHPAWELDVLEWGCFPDSGPQSLAGERSNHTGVAFDHY